MTGDCDVLDTVDVPAGRSSIEGQAGILRIGSDVMRGRD